MWGLKLSFTALVTSCHRDRNQQEMAAEYKIKWLELYLTNLTILAPASKFTGDKTLLHHLYIPIQSTEKLVEIL